MRLSFIWTEPTEHLFQEPLPDEPLAFLGREISYSERFKDVQRYEDDPDGLTPPWPKHREENFWYYYLGRQEPHEVDAANAWRHFVPFRWRPPLTVELGSQNARIDTEAFFYPSGHALMITAHLRPEENGGWSPEAVAEAANQFRFGAQLSTRWPDGTEQELKLDTWARIALGLLRRKSRGREGSAPSLTPYSVVTFTRVAGADPQAPMPLDGPVHRLLEAVSRWSKSWRVARLPALTEAVIADPDEPAGHAVYRDSAGRAIWLPELARPEAGHRLITCYHRNQAFAALQVESVGALVRRTADAVRRGRQVPFVQHQCSRIGAGLLGRMYGGAKATYQSLACKRHMEDRDIASDLAYLRDEYGMNPLH